MGLGTALCGGALLLRELRCSVGIACARLSEPGVRRGVGGGRPRRLMRSRPRWGGGGGAWAGRTRRSERRRGRRTQGDPSVPSVCSGASRASSPCFEERGQRGSEMSLEGQGPRPSNHGGPRPEVSLERCTQHRAGL